jgi:putative ribosome biogenesis GTPase RsgA
MKIFCSIKIYDRLDFNEKCNLSTNFSENFYVEIFVKISLVVTWSLDSVQKQHGISQNRATSVTGCSSVGASSLLNNKRACM